MTGKFRGAKNSNAPEIKKHELSIKSQCNVTSISINDLTVETVDISKVVGIDYPKWCEIENLDFAAEKILLTAGDPTTHHKILRNMLTSENIERTNDIYCFLLFNPMLPQEIAAKFIRASHQQNLEKLGKLSITDLRKRYENLSNNKDLVLMISFLQNSFVEEEASMEWEYEAVLFLRESFTIFARGSNEQKTLLKRFFPGTYQFLEKMCLQKIIEPFLFWTLDDDHLNLFDRLAFSRQFDSRILVVKDAWHDPAEITFCTHPEEFKPLAEVNPDYIYNIESGLFALTNKLIETSDLNEIGFEVISGMGDGYYPTIPFFDHLGELQMVTTYFTHMIDSEWLDHGLEDGGWRLHSHHVPLEMGYLDCDGSFFFGDSTWFHNGPGDDLIVEFSDMPADRYLVVRFIDVDSENRTGAVSVMRDKAKRNFEILFKVFPELTKRNDDF